MNRTSTTNTNRFRYNLLEDENADIAMSHLIFFIAAVIIAMSIVAIVTVNVQNITGATTAGSQTLADQLRTDITIINDPEMVIRDEDNNITFYIKNTGSSEINAQYMTIVLNGAMVSSNDIRPSINGDTEHIMAQPGDVIVLEISDNLVDDERLNRVLISTENGKTATMNFKLKNN
ncbi:flagellar protein G [Methanosalsum natronophilum]|uniref:Flagellar protein G n=1 Tax=Methanosalsum natronophilum TaxID=768733 RepID=A0A3R7YJ31_9EURY|nr:MAG: flagellar protein G [Methanosalsum natronophilum]